MRLIDADMLLNSFKGAKKLGVNAIKYYVDNTPTIDLANISRKRKENDMGKYCRYCGHCIDNGYNDYYCTLKEKFLTTETVKHWACGSFGDCGIDVITGEDRKERKSFTRTKKVDDGEQIKIGE